MKPFRDSVLEIVRAIPRGSVMTYKEVAERAGEPNASRAVGSYMRKNFDPTVPCHRVIHSNGTIGNYNRGGPERKIELLRAEGAHV